MEALILTLDVACMVYLCWRIFKIDRKTKNVDLGWFAYREERDDA
ncbi:hypothetical protein [Hydrogenophaga sp.]|nr:hypothetical protein [Hydrogenophaga sp.]MDP2073790.1 hypothetical protein [Hydrogenophaga sp.]MDP3106914.1 hypothetical protein [Hydrogenophaga sp.]MDZ4397934.1 hypothetical protein [Hydrogenophaga sp.]